MSYYASGSGMITFKPDVEDKVRTMLAEHHAVKPEDSIADMMAYSGWRYSPDGDKKDTYWMEFEYDRFSDADDVLYEIAPFVKEGHIEMLGEDEDQWQYAFTDGKLKEYKGVVTFPGSPYEDPFI